MDCYHCLDPVRTLAATSIFLKMPTLAPIRSAISGSLTHRSLLSASYSGHPHYYSRAVSNLLNPSSFSTSSVPHSNTKHNPNDNANDNNYKSTINAQSSSSAREEEKLTHFGFKTVNENIKEQKGSSYFNIATFTSVS